MRNEPFQVENRLFEQEPRGGCDQGRANDPKANGGAEAKHAREVLGADVSHDGTDKTMPNVESVAQLADVSKYGLAQQDSNPPCRG